MRWGGGRDKRRGDKLLKELQIPEVMTEAIKKNRVLEDSASWRMGPDSVCFQDL